MLKALAEEKQPISQPAKELLWRHYNDYLLTCELHAGDFNSLTTASLLVKEKN